MSGIVLDSQSEVVQADMSGHERKWRSSNLNLSSMKCTRMHFRRRSSSRQIGRQVRIFSKQKHSTGDHTGKERSSIEESYRSITFRK